MKDDLIQEIAQVMHEYRRDGVRLEERAEEILRKVPQVYEMKFRADLLGRYDLPAIVIVRSMARGGYNLFVAYDIYSDDFFSCYGGIYIEQSDILAFCSIGRTAEEIIKEMK